MSKKCLNGAETCQKPAASGGRPRALGKLVERLQKQREKLARMSRTSATDIGDTKGDDVDGASAGMATEILCHLLRSECQKLRDIDDALRRTREGCYGVCMRCGENIPLRRLRAVPTTEYCVDHADGYSRGAQTTNDQVIDDWPNDPDEDDKPVGSSGMKAQMIL